MRFTSALYALPLIGAAFAAPIAKDDGLIDVSNIDAVVPVVANLGLRDGSLVDISNIDAVVPVLANLDTRDGNSDVLNIFAEIKANVDVFLGNHADGITVDADIDVALGLFTNGFHNVAAIVKADANIDIDTLGKRDQSLDMANVIAQVYAQVAVVLNLIPGDKRSGSKFDDFNTISANVLVGLNVYVSGLAHVVVGLLVKLHVNLNILGGMLDQCDSLLGGLLDNLLGGSGGL